MAPDERAEAERLMRKRDRDEAIATGRMRPGLLYGKNVVANSFIVGAMSICMQIPVIDVHSSNSIKSLTSNRMPGLF